MRFAGEVDLDGRVDLWEVMAYVLGRKMLGRHSQYKLVGCHLRSSVGLTVTGLRGSFRHPNHVILEDVL